MILHIDMDAFYASVEQLDNPWLRGKCVLVGGSSTRGVVMAASYEARRFGVHSATPAFKARQMCPQGIFIAPRMKRYKEISKKIMAILREFTPEVEVVSIDEAYLDIAGSKRLHGDPEKVARAIKKEIKDTLQLTCSVGVAPGKFLAKVASDLDKPDGLTVIRPDGVHRFIATLPIEKVPGVGKKTFRQLESMGINTLGDIKKFPEKLLLDRLGKFGNRLLELSSGMDYSAVTPDAPHKSVSSERTLAEDTRDKELLNTYMLKQAEEVARQLRKANVKAKTVTLKLKHADFKQVTRSKTIADPTQSSKTIYRCAAQLLEEYRLIQKVRLVGVGTSGFKSSGIPVQLDLFDRRGESDSSWTKVDQTLETITNKFGKDAIKRATLRDD
ncbi:DNA polymerase IV (EC [Olavius sp. associated proteobacterium Delta 1]|nr:DNA polymerase IV (EC [Olavius sp. associated proteobacterium Delta 1]